MILLIDGYNLLKNMMTPAKVSEEERKKFLEILGSYARKKHHTMVIVFDGGPYDWPHKERFMNMLVIYSGYKQSADDFIMHYIDDHKTKDMLLISSDHEINLFASKANIPSLGSQEFGTLLKESSIPYNHQQSQTPFIVYQSENKDLDIIMEEGSRAVPLKEEDAALRRKSTDSHGESKLSKKLLHILRKL